MDWSVIQNISSPDGNVRTQAVEMIQKASGDPGFIGVLLEAAKNPPNPNLQLTVLLVLLDVIRRRVNDLADDGGLMQELVNLLFALPFELRPHIEEGILLIALFAKDTDFGVVFKSVLDAALAQQPVNARNVCTAMSLAAQWVHRSPSSTFLSDLGAVVGPLIGAVAQDSEAGPKTIGVIADLVKTLVKRRHIVLNGSFDEIVKVVSQVVVMNGDSAVVLDMKVMIIDMYVALVSAVFEDWKAIEEIVPWREHFIAELLPIVFEASLEIPKLPLNEKIVCHLLRLFYVYLYFEIKPDMILSQEFFEKYVIPCARLTEDDLSDFDDSPCQFIAFCCEHRDSGFYSPRICASKIVDVVFEKYKQVFNPVPMLSQPCDDPIMFEAKIFLLERCAMRDEIPRDVFESYFNLLTQDQPLYIVAALLRMIAPIMANNDGVVGIGVAEHFIVNAECLIIRFCAICLMLKCFSDFDSRLEDLNAIVELDLESLTRSLLQISNSLPLAEPSVLLEKLFLMAGTKLVEIVPNLVQQFFGLWHAVQGEDDDNSEFILAPSLMNSIASVCEMIPPNSSMAIALAKAVLTQLAADIVDFPDNSSFSDQLAVAAVFSRKLSNPVPEQLMFIHAIFTTQADPSVLITNLNALVCPIMLNPQSGFNEYEPLVAMCESLISPETDVDVLAQCLVLLACMIQARGVEMFPFVQTACQVLAAKQKSVILAGCLYVFATAFYVNAEAAKPLFNDQIVSVICDGIAIQAGFAYRELKLAMILLSYFTREGSARAFEVATSFVLGRLLEMKALDDELPLTPDSLIKRKRLHEDEGLVSLSPLLALPIDSCDELVLFRSVTPQ